MLSMLNDCTSTHTAASGDGDLYGVSARDADILNIEWFVWCFLFPAVNVEGRCVDGRLHRRRPVGVHLPILVVETLQLKLQVGPLDNHHLFLI